jgi:hypothetical protein
LQYFGTLSFIVVGNGVLGANESADDEDHVVVCGEELGVGVGVGGGCSIRVYSHAPR